MTEARQKTGSLGEQIAWEYLAEKGYRLVERNHRCNWGEIDIILEIEEFLVFCEVKTRRGLSGPHPSLSVTSRKKRKLRQLGERYLSQRHLTHKQPRFDVIAVQLVGEKPPIIEHIINAF